MRFRKRQRESSLQVQKKIYMSARMKDQANTLGQISNLFLLPASSVLVSSLSLSLAVLLYLMFSILSPHYFSCLNRETYTLGLL